MYEQQILKLVRQDAPDDPISYVHNIVADYSQEQISAAIKRCNKCTTCSKIRSIPKGRASKASILIVSDCITEYRVNTVFPVASVDRENLEDMLHERLKLREDSIVWVNAVNCYATQQRPPNKDELHNCKIFLERMINTVRPKYIVFLGNVALNSLLSVSLYKVRGQWLEYKGIPCMATYNPRELRVSKRETAIVNEMADDLMHDLEELVKRAVKDYPELHLLKEEV